MRALALALTAATVLGLATGCASDPAEPEVSTVGLLSAQELGPGEWNGPFTETQDSNTTYRSTTCAVLGGVFYDRSSLVARQSIVWANDEITVESIAYYFGDDRSALDEQIKWTDFSQTCVHEAGSSPFTPEGYFTWERSGDVFTMHERNGKTGYLWDFDIAVASTEDSLVAVIVSYPTGTTGYPAVEELLDPAIEASADLPALATQGATER